MLCCVPCFLGFCDADPPLPPPLLLLEAYVLRLPSILQYGRRSECEPTYVFLQATCQTKAAAHVTKKKKERWVTRFPKSLRLTCPQNSTNANRT